MDYGPTSLKVNFVQECLHQVDAAATQGQNVFNRCWIRNFGRIKPLSFVPDDNRNSSARLNATRDANFLSRISEIAVEHCVRQGLSESPSRRRFHSQAYNAIP